LTKISAYSAPMKPIPKATRPNHRFDPSGSIDQIAPAPPTYISENSTIQGRRLPVVSATAPMIGAPKPMISPVTVRHHDHMVCARASAASSLSPVVMKWSEATEAK
jgi:hypothetical protein